MRTSRFYGLMVCLLVAGCWNGTDSDLPDGNDGLGIATFVHEDVGDQTTVRGLDARGDEVARLDLVHGRFTLSPPFTEESDTPEVDGRKLRVTVLGQQLHWETVGFEAVLEMPAHPRSQWALATFLADPHVKPVLDRWQIGFQPFESEVAYLAGGFRGDSPQTCDGQTTCGTAYFGTISLCPGGNSIKAARVTQQSGTNCGLYTGPTNPEVRVAQCCPSTTGILGVPWFAQKVCPTTNTTSTSCGTVPSGVCKGCPGYPVAAPSNCTLSVGATVGSCSSVSVYPVDFSYDSYTYLKSAASGDDKFGQHVSMSADGNTVAISGLDGYSGAAYVFVNSSNVWSQEAYIPAPSPLNGSQFGDGLALSDDGNTLAVGAEFESGNASGINGNETDTSLQWSGAAYVYTRSGGVWTKQAYVKASNPGAGDRFGISVALSSNGNTLAVAAYAEDSNATGINGNQSDNSAADAGAVYVFTRSGTTWTQQAYIKASNTGAGDFFGGEQYGLGGLALSDDGNTLVVGANYEDSNATGINGNQSDNSAESAGAVYAFTRSGTTWSQQAYIKASNSYSWAEWGRAVTLSGDGNTLAVTKAQTPASVFVRSGTVWSQQTTVSAASGESQDFFGKSVALSPDGNTLVVGASAEDSNAIGIGGNQADNSATDAGAVYRFTRVGTTWTEDRYIKASNTASGDLFGSGVAVTNDGTILVGARGEDSSATGVNGDHADNSDSDSGAAYIIK